MISLIGLPWDGSSSFMRGAADAPDEIRRAIECPSSNLAIETGGTFRLGDNVIDLGNLVDLSDLDSATAMDRVAQGIEDALHYGRPLLSVGGDHSISWPILRATAPQYERLTILHLDAHPDLYPDFEGDPFSHACPFARVMESFDHVDLIQVGIRTMNDTCRVQAHRFDVTVVDARAEWDPALLPADQPVYVSLDLDVLDPAFAPGVSHHEPGGLSTRELISILHSIRAPVIGADLVELNPQRDIKGMTAMVAAKLTNEIAGLMLRNC